MKKISLILFTVFLSAALFSCTPSTIADNDPASLACCGDDVPIPPPPPPGSGG